ncbi:MULTISPECIES: hypothetical protein [Xanthomonas]|uniref:hypothetical protein n=1 Tax=Xanthomonas TaxID=338 RepID=UPI001AD9A3EC|nr:MULTISPECIES: hypothetical protein [unclassified Xanthomonas]MBO9873518.1 hypothetical protein [Xanthomonas sp. D-93]WNH45299.1 hypothetical protein PG878_02150 [Xanthomonas sp. A6251]
MKTYPRIDGHAGAPWLGSPHSGIRESLQWWPNQWLAHTPEQAKPEDFWGCGAAGPRLSAMIGSGELATAQIFTQAYVLIEFYTNESGDRHLIEFSAFFYNESRTYASIDAR